MSALPNPQSTEAVVAVRGLTKIFKEKCKIVVCLRICRAQL